VPGDARVQPAVVLARSPAPCGEGSIHAPARQAAGPADCFKEAGACGLPATGAAGSGSSSSPLASNAAPGARWSGGSGENENRHDNGTLLAAGADAGSTGVAGGVPAAGSVNAVAMREALAAAGQQGTVPLAFKPLPPEVAGNPAVTDAIADLKSQFTSTMGGTGLDPTSPAYAERWQLEAQRLDEAYHLLVGDQAFMAEQASINNK